MRWLDGITDLMEMSLSRLLEIVKDREAWLGSPWVCKQLHTTEQLNNNIFSYKHKEYFRHSWRISSLIGKDTL